MCLVLQLLPPDYWLLVEVIHPMRVTGSSESVFCLYLYLVAKTVAKHFNLTFEMSSEEKSDVTQSNL